MHSLANLNNRRQLPQSPPTEATTAAAQDRPSNVTDALSYLDACQFQDQPDVYNHFLDVMKDFKSQLYVLASIISHRFIHLAILCFLLLHTHYGVVQLLPAALIEVL